MDKPIMQKMEVTANLKKLNDLIYSLTGANKMYVKVGVLSKDNARSDGESNASIGALHEFGSTSRHIPARSFLKMPLTKKANEMLKTVMTYAVPMLLEKDPEALLGKIGITAEDIVQQAFMTGGFGTWKKLSAMTIALKKSDAILIDKGFLSKSITSAVVKGA